MSEVTDDDVRKLFEQIFQARRTRAAIAVDLRKAELTLEHHRKELESADEGIATLEQRMQDLADRAAGARLPPTDEDASPNPLDDYRPIVRR